MIGMVMSVHGNNRMEPQSAPKIVPLLKWAGGKRRLLSHILPLLPANPGRYFEPFVGGGAVFFAYAPASAYLSDSNGELIELYSEIRDRPSRVISALSRMTNDEATYYRIRSTLPEGKAERAARFLYLTTLSFNGLYRQNLKGAFNVPYGHKVHLDPCDRERILEASSALRRATLRAVDFEAAVQSAKSGDVIYFDPPYTVAHGNNGFIKYNAKIFSWDDQRRLSALARNLWNRGCHVLVSNADHPSIKDLYVGFKTVVIKRPSVMAASPEFRKSISECVFVGQSQT
jgi:DNA adenine methylase